MPAAARRLAVPLAAALAVASAGTRARAQDAGVADGATDAATEDPQSVAQREFETGVTAFDAGRHDEALTHFLASLEAFPSPNTRLYVARALASVGRVGEAVIQYDRTASEATELAARVPRYSAAADAARSEARALDRRVGRVTLSAQGLPAGSRIRIADTTLSLEEASRPVAVTPGTVRVRIEADGFEATEQDVQVAAGQTVALIPVGLHRAGEDAGVTVGDNGSAQSGATAAPASSSETPGASAGSQPVVPIGAVVGWGVGVGGLAAFGIFAYLADQQYRSLPAICGQMPCPASQQGAVDAGRNLEVATNVALAVGVVGLAAGTAFFAWDRLHPRRARPVSLWILGPTVLVGGTF